MKVLETGGTGAIGRHDVTALTAAGREVTALSPGAEGLAWLGEQGATPVKPFTKQGCVPLLRSLRRSSLATAGTADFKTTAWGPKSRKSARKDQRLSSKPQ